MFLLATKLHPFMAFQVKRMAAAAATIPNLSKDVWTEELSDSEELKQVYCQSNQGKLFSLLLVLGEPWRGQKWCLQRWICPLSAVWPGETNLSVILSLAF